MTTTDYMPEEGKTYKLLDPGFDKVYVFGHVLGPWPFNDGYIIADCWEDAHEELCQYAFDSDGPCDHGNDPELAALIEAVPALGTSDERRHEALEACWRWVDEHCDCTSFDGGYVWLVDSWWVNETAIKPLDLVRALRQQVRKTDAMSWDEYDACRERLDDLIDWYEED